MLPPSPLVNASSNNPSCGSSQPPLLHRPLEWWPPSLPPRLRTLLALTCSSSSVSPVSGSSAATSPPPSSRLHGASALATFPLYTTPTILTTPASSHVHPRGPSRAPRRLLHPLVHLQSHRPPPSPHRPRDLHHRSLHLPRSDLPSTVPCPAAHMRRTPPRPITTLPSPARPS